MPDVSGRGWGSLGRLLDVEQFPFHCILRGTIQVIVYSAKALRGMPGVGSHPNDKVTRSQREQGDKEGLQLGGGWGEGCGQKRRRIGASPRAGTGVPQCTMGQRGQRNDGSAWAAMLQQGQGWGRVTQVPAEWEGQSHNAHKRRHLEIDPGFQPLCPLQPLEAVVGAQGGALLAQPRPGSPSLCDVRFCFAVLPGVSVGRPGPG